MCASILKDGIVSIFQGMSRKWPTKDKIFTLCSRFGNRIGNLFGMRLRMAGSMLVMKVSNCSAMIVRDLLVWSVGSA